MKLDKRLSSYPILVNEDDDYVDSYFETTLNQHIEFGKLIVEVDFDLSNEGLLELINTEKAMYAVHVECSLLSFREVHMSKEKQMHFEIDLNTLSDKVEVSCFIVAVKDIQKYYNEKFNWVFGKDGVNITKGNILAIGATYNIDIDRSKEGLKKLSDVIVIQQDDSNKGPMSINLIGDVITILVNEDVKNKYYNCGKEYLYNVISMIMVPAMIHVLTNMKNNSDLESYRWYKVIEQLLKQNEIEIDQLNTEDSSGKYSVLEVAQKIFKSPLEKGLSELIKNSDRRD